MKTLRRSLAALCALAVLLAMAAPSLATVRVTVRNNRNHDMYFAFRWSGETFAQDRRIGWYKVNARSNKTFSFKEASYTLTPDTFGYYAKGGSHVWSGKSGDREMRTTIHPTKAFKGSPHDDSLRGGKTVYFRRVKLRPSSSRDSDGSATLTFNH